MRMPHFAVSEGVAPVLWRWTTLLGADVVEILKWLGATFMVVDHVNAYLLDWRYPWMYYVGRVAFPLFAIALGVSLAGRDLASVNRAFKRTLIVACIAQPLSGLVRDPAPWNILFVLAVGLLIVSQIERRTWKVALSIVGALFVCPFAEFSVAGPVMAVAGIYFGRNPSIGSAVSMICAVAFLESSNGNQFAMLAIPLLVLACYAKIRVPHVRHSMQAIYCGQFPLLWLGKVLT